MQKPFATWVDNFAEPEWASLPATHITRTIDFEKAILAGELTPRWCETIKKEVVFLFYGRAAYRVNEDGAIRSEALCPVCLVLDPSIIKQLSHLYPFDTGAFARRLYTRALGPGIPFEDFELTHNPRLADKLINGVWQSFEGYLDGDNRTVPSVEKLADVTEMAPRMYLELLKNRMRNEPDDRVGSIEIGVDSSINLKEVLMAVILPDAFDLDVVKESSWLGKLQATRVDIRFYHYVPGRGPEWYHAHVETELKNYFREKGML